VIEPTGLSNSARCRPVRHFGGRRPAGRSESGAAIRRFSHLGHSVSGRRAAEHAHARLGVGVVPHPCTSTVVPWFCT